MDASCESALPLSSQQERFWLLHRAWGRTAELELTFPVRLRGPLDHRMVAAALSALVRRHAIWRTVYTEGPHGPMQRVLPARPIELPYEDLTLLDAAARDQRIADACARTHTSQIDLAISPIHVELFRTAPDEHLLFVIVHHIACDLWTMRLWRDELVTRCAAAVSGRDPELPELPLAYGDYAVWQRSWLDARRDDGIAFWRRRVTAAPPLVVPDALRAEEPVSFAHEWHSRAGMVDRLAEAGRPDGATPSMVALAAFFALVRSWGNAEALIGMPLANRLRPQHKDVHGVFMNLALVRIDLQIASSFRALVKQVRRELVAAHAHQDVPFFWAMPPGQGPPHRLLFNYVNGPSLPARPAAPVALDKPVLPGVHVARNLFLADLYLEALPDGRLYGRLDVRARRDANEVARSLADQYRALLESAV